MRLIKIQFTAGLDCEAYQVVDSNGVVVQYKDADGNVLTLPEECESCVTDDNPESPGWFDA